VGDIVVVVVEARVVGPVTVLVLGALVEVVAGRAVLVVVAGIRNVKLYPPVHLFSPSILLAWEQL
jgi:hypothetical protein